MQNEIARRSRQLAIRAADGFLAAAVPVERPSEVLLVDDIDDFFMVVATLDISEVQAHFDVIELVLGAEGNPESDLADLATAMKTAAAEVLSPANARMAIDTIDSAWTRRQSSHR